MTSRIEDDRPMSAVRHRLETLKAVAKRAALPFVLVVAAVAVIAAAVAAAVVAATVLGGSDQLWGQVVAGVSLFVVSLLMFATGKRTYTVREAVLHGEQDYAEGDEIPPLVYQKLEEDKDKEKLEKIESDGETHRATKALKAPKAFAIDLVLDPDDYNGLGADKKHVQLQRGLYFRGLYVGAECDGQRQSCRF